MDGQIKWSEGRQRFADMVATMTEQDAKLAASIQQLIEAQQALNKLKQGPITRPAVNATLYKANAAMNRAVASMMARDNAWKDVIRKYNELKRDLKKSGLNDRIPAVYTNHFQRSRVGLLVNQTRRLDLSIRRAFRI